MSLITYDPKVLTRLLKDTFTFIKITNYYYDLFQYRVLLAVLLNQSKSIVNKNTLNHVEVLYFL